MLKKSILLCLFCLFALGLQAQEMSMDELSIKKVIETETVYANQKNFEKFSNMWVQSPQATWVVSGPTWNDELNGWEAIAEFFKESFVKNPEPVTTQQKKNGYQFTVVGDMAFVTFREDGNMSTRVLQKQDKQWKLLHVGVVGTKAYEAEEKKDKLEAALDGLVGSWKAIPSTMVTKADWGGELKDAKCKVVRTKSGLKMYIEYQMKDRDGNTFTIDEEMTMAKDSRSGKLGVSSVTTGDDWSQVEMGICTPGEDGTMVIDAKQLGSETDGFKQKIKMKSDGVIGMEYKIYYDEGQKSWSLVFDMKRM